MSSEKNNEFKAINISVLTISDSRTIEQDDSGEYLVSALEEQGHVLSDRKICKDNLYEIRAIISQWILDAASSPLVAQELRAKMEHPRPSCLFWTKPLMALVKCSDPFLTKTLKHQPCNPEPLQGLPMGHLSFAFPAHRVLVRTAGIS